VNGSYSGRSAEAGIHRIETASRMSVATTSFAAPIVAAVHQARPLRLRLASYTPNSTSAGNGAEGGHDARVGILFASSSAPDEVCAATSSVSSSFSAASTSRRPCRQLACLLENIVEPQPVHGQPNRIRILRGFARRAGPRLAARLARKPLQLPLAAGIAGRPPRVPLARRSFLASRPSDRTENAKSHVLS